MTARLYTLDPLDGFRPMTFAGHKNAVLNAHFSSNSKSVSIMQDSSMHPANHRGPIRYTLSAVTVLFSSGEPRPPTLPLMMTAILIARQLLGILRLLAFVGVSINDITSTNPIQKSFAALSIRPQACSLSAFPLESSGSGRCPHSQTCIH
jgi:hypothetical protein